jgi:hypothetical protein
MFSITEPARETPVALETQVLVAGGGIAGIAAAQAAARRGRRVTLIERGFAVGGMATLGLITIYLPLCDGCGNQLVFGIGEELLRLSIKHGHEGRYPAEWLGQGTRAERTANRFTAQFNPQLFALEAERLLLDAGVEIVYGTVAVGAQVGDGVIKNVLVENKSGRTAIAAGSVIDCTGDADICGLAGAPTVLKSGGNGLASWYYYFDGAKVRLKMFGLADVVPDEGDNVRADGSDTYSAGKTESLDQNYRFSGVDGYELSRAVLAGHGRMLDDILAQRGGNPELVPVTMSTIPLVRMSRRLDGEYTMRCADDHRELPDSVGMTGDWCRRGSAYEIPFSALRCGRIKNLLAAGRCISADDEMWNVTRVIPPCAVSGQAAGTAAALTADFSAVDIDSLQAALLADNVKLHF